MADDGLAVDTGETQEQKYKRLYEEAQARPPVQVVVPQELQDTITSLRTEVQELKAKPQASTGDKTWVDYIREGDYKGAEAAMEARVAKGLEGKFNEVRQAAYNDALSANDANYQMREYVAAVKAANPDIAKMQKYLEAPVAARIETARQAGKIKSTQDLVTAYKAAVDAEVADLRNLGLQFRAAGKDEALTRSSQVISSTALTPQQVSNERITSSETTEQGESTESYFARRRQDGSRRHGLS